MWVVKLELHFMYHPGTVLERHTKWYIIAQFYYQLYFMWYYVSIQPIKRLVVYKTHKGVVRLKSTKQVSEGDYRKFRNKRSG